MSSQAPGASSPELWDEARWHELLKRSREALREAFPGTEPSAIYQLCWEFFSESLEAWVKGLTEMARSPGTDPFQNMQRVWMAQLEALNQGFAKAMGTEAFSALLGKYLEQTLLRQARAVPALNPQLEAALRALNLPSKGQIDRLFERVIGLEEQVDELQAQSRKVLSLLRDSGPALGSTPQKAAGPTKRLRA